MKPKLYEPPAEPYYLQRLSVLHGNAALWWRRQGHGYTADLREARLFSKADALRLAAAYPATDAAWPRAYIDARQCMTVDAHGIHKDDAAKFCAAPTDSPKGNFPCSP